MALMTIRGLGLTGRLRPLDFDVQAGEVLGVIGPNGSGKTTLLRAMAGLGSDSGQIMLTGAPLNALAERTRARLIGLMPQNCSSAWSLSVREVVALGRLPWGDPGHTQIETALTRTGLDSLAERAIDRLSGGEQARAWLARVLAGTPQLLLADEPVASLDLRQQHEVLKLFREQAAAGSGVVIALHDLSLAARYCDRLLLLSEGRLIALGRPDEVLQADRLRAVYGIDLRIANVGSKPMVFVD